MVLDDLLESHFPESCEVMAYADDVAICISGSSRRVLEERAASCINTLETWLTLNKISASKEKSVYMLLGKQLSDHHRPVIRLCGLPVNKVTSYKYLGLMIDPKLFFQQHIDFVAAKAKKLFASLRRYTRRLYTSPFSSLLTIYRHAVIPIVGYALPIWNCRLTQKRVIRKLNEAQAFCLRTAMLTYRSVPADAISVLCRCLPLHLELQLTHAIAEFKNTGSTALLNTNINIRDFRYLAQVHYITLRPARV